MLAASGKVVTALERDISAPAATTFVENVAQMLGLKASRVPPCAIPCQYIQYLLELLRADQFYIILPCHATETSETHRSDLR